MVNRSAAACWAPARVPTLPTGIELAMWIAKAAVTSGSWRTPCSIMGWAPPGGASSQGWNSTLTVPPNSSRRSISIRATPSWMAVWASCPQACITPGVWLRYSTSFSSSMGSASMSARSKMTLPAPGPSGLVPRTRAVTPVLAIPVRMSSRPSWRRRSATNFAVSCSCIPSSGCSWRWRRSATRPGRISSTASCRVGGAATIGDNLRRGSWARRSAHPSAACLHSDETRWTIPEEHPGATASFASDGPVPAVGFRTVGQAVRSWASGEDERR